MTIASGGKLVTHFQIVDEITISVGTDQAQNFGLFTLTESLKFANARESLVCD